MKYFIFTCLYEIASLLVENSSCAVLANHLRSVTVKHAKCDSLCCYTTHEEKRKDMFFNKVLNYVYSYSKNIIRTIRKLYIDKYCIYASVRTQRKLSSFSNLQIRSVLFLVSPPRRSLSPKGLHLSPFVLMATGPFTR